MRRQTVPTLILSLCLASVPLSAYAAPEPYVDAEMGFSIALPEGAQPVTPRPGAACEWSLPSGASLWIRAEKAPPTAELTPYESVVLDTVQGLIDEGWTIARSTRLEDAELQGHGVDQGVAMRLGHPGTGAAVVIVILQEGPHVYTLCTLMPAEATRDPVVARALSEAVSSFRVHETTVADATEGTHSTTEGELTSVITAGPTILTGRTALLAYQFDGGPIAGWQWRVPERMPEPAPAPGAGLAFVSSAGDPLDVERPAPMLVGQAFVPPFEAVVELLPVPDSEATGRVVLTLFDDPARAIVVTVTRGGEGWAIEGAFRRHSRDESQKLTMPGDTLWVRMICDGTRAALFASTNGSHWLPVHPGRGPQPFRLTMPALGIAMPEPVPSCARVSRVAIVSMDGVPAGPRVEGLMAQSHRLGPGSLVISCGFGAPEDSAVAEIEMVIQRGGQDLRLRFARPTPGAPLTLVEAPDGAIVGHVVVPRSDGGVTLHLTLAGPEDGSQVTVLASAFTDSGLGSGLWRLEPGSTQRVDGED